MQLGKDELTSYMKDSRLATNHVIDIVENKLCTAECVVLDQRSKGPYSKGITAIQYITRQNLKASDPKFSHHVKSNLIDFIVRKFFNSKYIERVLAFHAASNSHVIICVIPCFWQQ